MDDSPVHSQVVAGLARVRLRRMTVAMALLTPATIVGVGLCIFALGSGALDDGQQRIGLLVLGFPTAWLVMLTRHCLQARRDAGRIMRATTNSNLAWVLRGRVISGDRDLSLPISRHTRDLLTSPPRAAVVK